MTAPGPTETSANDAVQPRLCESSGPCFGGGNKESSSSDHPDSHFDLSDVSAFRRSQTPIASVRCLNLEFLVDVCAFKHDAYGVSGSA